MCRGRESNSRHKDFQSFALPLSYLGIFTSYAQEAEKVWESKLKKDVFVYDPTSEFTVRFLYDTRQENTFHAQKIEDTVKKQTSEYEKQKEEFEEQNTTLEKKVQNYNSLVEKYETRLQNFDNEIALWNEKGGAPPETYERLQKEQIELQKEQVELNALAQALNQKIIQVQDNAQELNTTVTTINQNVDTYNTLFEDMPTFDKGIYNGGEIVLYQFTSEDDLILTLAHEFGHALGIGHVDDTSSIMHSSIQDQSLNPIEPTFFDISEAKTVCKFTN